MLVLAILKIVVRLPDQTWNFNMALNNSPALLLLITGGLLGLTFPLGKLASSASVSPVIWAWLVSAGAGFVLLFFRVLSGNSVSLKSNFIKYYCLSSVCSLVIPNLLIFYVIPKLGSGFTSILFTLSPIFTLAISSIWQVRLPTWLGIVGVGIGFLGAVIVTVTRGELGEPASVFWVLTGMAIPVSLAIGNLYRTVAWPKGADPIELAIGSNLSSAILLFLIAIATAPISEFLQLLTIEKISLMQIVASASMFSVFYRLQYVGGPTYLSQIGYVAAAIALFAGTVFLGERYSTLTWVGAAVIVVGIGFSIAAQRQKSP